MANLEIKGARNQENRLCNRIGEFVGLLYPYSIKCGCQGNIKLLRIQNIDQWDELGFSDWTRRTVSQAHLPINHNHRALVLARLSCVRAVWRHGHHSNKVRPGCLTIARMNHVFIQCLVWNILDHPKQPCTRAVSSLDLRPRFSFTGNSTHGSPVIFLDHPCNNRTRGT
jgi:hypothetical protein